LPIAQQIVERFTDFVGLLGIGFQGDWKPLMEFLDQIFGRETANNIGNFIIWFQDARGEVEKLIAVFQTKGLTEMLKVWVGDIEKWVKSNAPDWAKVFETWKTNFWNWLTDPHSGLLVTIADNMKNLADGMEKWSKEPATQKQMNEIGEGLARNVLQGIGNLFDNPNPSGESLLERLFNSLHRAQLSLDQFWRNIGWGIAVGVAEGIADFFGGAEMQRRLVYALNGLVAQWNELVGNSPLGHVPTIELPASTNPGSGVGGTSSIFSGVSGGVTLGASFARGGFIPRNMLAMLHAGEYVLPKSEVDAQRNGGRSINLTIAPVFNAPIDKSNARSIIQQIRDIAHEEISNVMAAA
jgi:hypothetical protein